LYIWLEPNSSWAVGRIAGNIVLSRDYFVSQVTSLLKFAKETTNPQLAAVLIEKAADLKSQVDESSTTPDPSPQTPDVQPETSPRATNSPLAELLKAKRDGSHDQVASLVYRLDQEVVSGWREAEASD
jgi:hypothetical protein